MKSVFVRLMAAAVVCLMSATGYAGIQDGLINYWNLDGNFDDTAGSVAGNTSTVADNGTQPASGVSFAPSPTGVGEYAVFDASPEGYIEVLDSADIVAAGETLSISAWFTVNQFDKGWQALIAHGEASDYRIARRGGGSNIMSYAGGTGDIPTDDSTGPNVNDGGWHHVVSISPSGAPSELWVDGELVATGGNTALTDNGSGRLMIGGNPDTSGNAFRTWDGGIDDVGMWDRQLTGEEIGAIFSAGSQGIPLSQAVVPEPGAGSMLLLATFGLTLLRRRK